MDRADPDHRKVHRSYRLPATTVERLGERARSHAIAETSLVERYLEEGLRQDAHPGIVFIDGLSGRRPRLAGTRLDVWMVIETFLDEGRSIQAAADYLNIAPALVRSAVGYYADHQAEIDDWIESNQRAFEQGAATARRIQALGG